MQDKNQEINWKEIYDLYNTIKWLYVLCEETDPELKTNLQPLNEFRAALDHVMRIIAIENLEDYKGKEEYDEVKKLMYWKNILLKKYKVPCRHIIRRLSLE